MEEQHPIPQQISAYQFRLVGDMTLKQFFQVAGGALVSLLIYSSSLPAYVKWPLIVFSFLLGVALAFFPLEDRPLAKWIVLFFKAIYSPTLYSWKKAAMRPTYFQPEPEATPITPPTTIQETISQAKVETGIEITPELKRLEEGEEKFLTNFAANFSLTPTPVIPETKKRDVYIPFHEKIDVKLEEKPQVIQQTPQTTTTSVIESKLTRIEGQVSQATQAAQFSAGASPSTPTKPNIIVGQVLDSEGKIIDAAILEIRDSDGRPVRALKSNKLGHFMIVTPLIDGKYEIITEKEGYAFDVLSIDAKGEIIRPIEIRAKARN